MKKIFAIMAILLLIPIAFAQTELIENEEATAYKISEDNLVEVSILPGSPIYGLSRAIERVRLVITRNPESRAGLRLEFASKRVAEARELQKRGQQDRVEQVLKDYESEMIELDKDVGNSRALGQDPEMLQAHVMEMTQKHRRVIELVIENAPEQAQPALQRVLENAQNRSEIREQKFGEVALKAMEQIQNQERNIGEENESELEQERVRSGIPETPGRTN